MQRLWSHFGVAIMAAAVVLGIDILINIVASGARSR